MALAAPECTPIPSDLHQKQPDEILSLYRQVEGLKSPQRPKALRLIEVAANSIGVTEGREMTRIEIASMRKTIKSVTWDLYQADRRLTQTE